MAFVELKISRCADDRGFVLVFFCIVLFWGVGVWVDHGCACRDGSNAQLPK
jgi:hypothetical protein